MHRGGSVQRLRLQLLTVKWTNWFPFNEMVCHLTLVLFLCVLFHVMPYACASCYVLFASDFRDVASVQYVP